MRIAQRRATNSAVIPGRREASDPESRQKGIFVASGFRVRAHKHVYARLRRAMGAPRNDGGGHPRVTESVAPRPGPSMPSQTRFVLAVLVCPPAGIWLQNVVPERPMPICSTDACRAVGCPVPEIQAKKNPRPRPTARIRTEMPQAASNDGGTREFSPMFAFTFRRFGCGRRPYDGLKVTEW
jgi:hypothetical protein